MRDGHGVIRVAARFCGPPDTANGGYLSGLLADAGAPIQVTLRRPVPLDTDLEVRRRAGATLLVRDGEVLVEAVSTGLSVDVPAPPDFQTAAEATTRYVAREQHPFPRCFVCGTQRRPGDGLRIFAGPLADRTLVAAPWVPDASLEDARGAVPDPVTWAALDCPGAYAGLIGRPPVAMVLGRIRGQVSRAVSPGDECVVIGWPISSEGRKQHVGTAIFDSGGRLCARAVATWFDVEASSFGP
jgi:hypothetical protein